MMILLAIGVGVVVLFVVGVSLVFSGSAAAASQKALARPAGDEPSEQTRQALDAARLNEEHLKTQLDKLAMDLQEAQSRAAENARLTEEVASLRAQASEADAGEAARLAAELQNLRAQESGHQQVIDRLGRDLDFLRDKADQQARDAVAVIEALSTEAGGLRQAVADAASRVDPETHDRLVQENEVLRVEVARQQEQVSQLEQQQTVAAQAQEARLAAASQELQTCRADIERLKSGLREIIARIKATGQELRTSRQAQEQEVQTLRAEKERLLQSAPSAEAVSGLEEAVAVLRREKEAVVEQSQDQVRQLQAQIQSLQKKISENQDVIDQMEGELMASRREMQRLRLEQEALAKDSLPRQRAGDGREDPSEEQRRLLMEQERLVREKEQLERLLAETRDANAFLQEKERVLQFELVKSRTEALGLKKICAGFKAQLAADAPARA